MAKRLGVFLALIAISVAAIFVNPPKAADSVLIGCITPLTGDGATYGAATQNGATLAIAKINSDGGIGGKQLAIRCEDDQMSGASAANAIQKLIATDKVPVILGAFGSSVTLAIAPIAERNKVVLFSASSTADSIKDAGDYIFRNVPPNAAQGTTAAEFARNQLKASSAGILQMNNDYGVSLAAAFVKAFTATGGNIVATESYNPKSTDFRAQLTKLRQASPDMIFFPGHYAESGLILKQASELGLKARFVGGDGSYSPELIQIGGAAAEGSYYTLMAMGNQETNAQAAAFVQSYQARFKSEPDVYSAYAYDAVLIIAEAIKQGGYTSDGIKKALYAMKDFPGVTGPTTFDDLGEVNKRYGIYEVSGGKFVRRR